MQIFIKKNHMDSQLVKMRFMDQLKHCILHDHRQEFPEAKREELEGLLEAAFAVELSIVPISYYEEHPIKTFGELMRKYRIEYKNFPKEILYEGRQFIQRYRISIGLHDPDLLKKLHDNSNRCSA
jgi:hypothetical protein